MLALWIGFVVFILALLALDLGVLNRRAHEIRTRDALIWVCVFVALALAFNVAVYFMYAHDWLGIGTRFAGIMLHDDPSPTPRKIGGTAAMQFLAGWLTEYSLSIDNLFVISVVFAYFRVPPAFQHRVLFWGIIGALVARGVMIFAGTALVQKFEWLLYILGAFLIFTGIRMAFAGDESNRDFKNIWIVRLAKRIFPITDQYEGQKLWTRLPTGALAATPLFLVLLIIETTDVVFAVDSIPAIIGITQDPFLVFTSNVFAILGLRSLYFALSGLMDKFHYLKYSLSLVLVFVGIKMLLEGAHLVAPLLEKLGPLPAWLGWLPREHIHVSTGVSLGIIVTLLAGGVVASLVHAKKHVAEAPAPPRA